MHFGPIRGIASDSGGCLVLLCALVGAKPSFGKIPHLRKSALSRSGSQFVKHLPYEEGINN